MRRGRGCCQERSGGPGSRQAAIRTPSPALRAPRGSLCLFALQLAEVLSSFSHNITEIQTSLGSLSSELGKDRDQVHEDRRSVVLTFLWVRVGQDALLSRPRGLRRHWPAFSLVLAGCWGRGRYCGPAGAGLRLAGRRAGPWALPPSAGLESELEVLARADRNSAAITPLCPWETHSGRSVCPESQPVNDKRRWSGFRSGLPASKASVLGLCWVLTAFATPFSLLTNTNSPPATADGRPGHPPQRRGRAPAPGAQF